MTASELALCSLSQTVRLASVSNLESAVKPQSSVASPSLRPKVLQTSQQIAPSAPRIRNMNLYAGRTSGGSGPAQRARPKRAPAAAQAPAGPSAPRRGQIPPRIAGLEGPPRRGDPAGHSAPAPRRSRLPAAFDVGSRRSRRRCRGRLSPGGSNGPRTLAGCW